MLFFSTSSIINAKRAMNYFTPSLRQSLQGLLLGAIRLGVCEGEPARALVEVVVAADHGLVASEHDAVQPEAGKDGAADAAEQVARLAGPGVAAVAVECGGGVMEG